MMIDGLMPYMFQGMAGCTDDGMSDHLRMAAFFWGQTATMQR